MSRNGYHFIGYSFLKYTFDYIPEEHYTYKIELLKSKPDSGEYQAYFDFLEETDITVVDTYMSWCYLRKPASAEGFELFTDYASRIAHQKRVLMLQGPIAIMNIYFGFYNLIIGMFVDSILWGVNTYLGMIILPLGLFIGVLALRTLKRINILKKEQEISES